MRFGRRPAPGEGEDEQAANLADAARRVGEERKGRGQTRRREAKEQEAAATEQPRDRP